ncbi:MAG TPA: hypothetical protein VG147_00250 [Solirubrobacteraceae bacterium]|jgi:hypothetical protein|nr:hypothetical protein [Solirubrobacteraceae bacterium]
MTKDEIQPQEFSTTRGNFLTVLLNLATGQSRILSDAEAARAAADATRRQANRDSGLRMLSSSAL